MLEPDKQKPVVILGAGIVGLFAAASLAREGYSVVLIDRRGAGEETSYGNLGGVQNMAAAPIGMPGMYKEVPKWLLDRSGPLSIRSTYFPQAIPWLLRFVKASRLDAYWRNAMALNDLNSDCVDSHLDLAEWAGARHLYRIPGQLYVWTKRSYFEKSVLSRQVWQRTGHEFQELSAAEIVEIEPAYKGAFQVGLRIPGNGYCVDPYQLCQHLLERCRAAGTVFMQAQASEILADGGRITGVRTDRGVVETGALIVSAGVWSKALLEPLGYKVPVESQRGYHVTLKNHNIEQTNMLLVMDRKIAITPMSMGLRVGGTVEFAGLHSKPDYERANRLTGIMRELVPDLSYEDSTEWAGHRPCMPDSVPVIGRTGKYANLLLAFGHGHMGLIGSAPTARILTNLIKGTTPRLDLNPFSVERFS